MLSLAKKALTCSLLLILPLTLSAAKPSEAERMKADLALINTVVNSGYAPAEWKALEFGWSIDDEIAKASARIDGTQGIDNKKFRVILKDLFNGFRDYHVSVFFYSTEMAFLPFRVKGAEGRYFIVYVEEGVSQPFSVGDEIVSFDGKPMAEVIKKLRLETTPNGNLATDNALAEIALIERIGAEGIIVPRGTVSVEVIPVGTNKSKKYVLKWDYEPERVKQYIQDTPVAADASPAKKLTRKIMESKVKVLPKYKHNKKIIAKHKKDDPTALGSIDSYVPRLGKPTWASDPDVNDFPAYIYKHPNGKKIGYIRIPEYDEELYDAGDFRKLIKMFENKTDALVIDQINNPGGSVFYTYSLLSMLATKPMHPPLDREAITHEQVMDAVEIIEMIKELHGSDLDDILDDDDLDYLEDNDLMHKMCSYFQRIIDAWENGVTLTEPHPLLGVDTIKPNAEVHYSKPILLLINELDISCGDMFPAILQDAKRATLFGTRTAGASGFINDLVFPNLSGIEAFTFTGSISERPDGSPIENVGIVPDIEYKLTVHDLQNGFMDYRDAINKAVNDLIQN